MRLSMVQALSTRQVCDCSWPWVVPSETLLPQQHSGDMKKKKQAKMPARPARQRVDLPKLLDRLPANSNGPGARLESTHVWLPPPPRVEKPRAVHNAASLAYLGDAIYEMYVRCHFLTPPQSLDKYNSRVMALVCCEAQDALLRRLVKDDFLSDEERNVVRWGKNVESGQRRATRRAGAAVYSSASSLETLIGYLYLNNGLRLKELMAKLGFGDESSSLLAGLGFGQSTTDGRPSSQQPHPLSNATEP